MSGSIVGTPIHMAPELFTGMIMGQCIKKERVIRAGSHNCSLFCVSGFNLSPLWHCLPTGKYDNSVDVYAFGILFWYLCTGSVKLPEAFEKCSSKDQLWNNVKKGKRPFTRLFESWRMQIIVQFANLGESYDACNEIIIPKQNVHYSAKSIHSLNSGILVTSTTTGV